MGLKLTVGKKDRIIMSNGVIITVKRLDTQVTLEFEAPKKIKIHTIFNDPSKQFKNLGKAMLKEAATIPEFDLATATPEQIREEQRQQGLDEVYADLKNNEPEDEWR